jgi:hypothetical protein
VARIIPRTLKGKVLASLAGLAAAAILALVLLVVLWTWLSWVLVVAFVTYGAVIVLASVGLMIYLIRRRRRLAALRLRWIDRETQVNA